MTSKAQRIAIAEACGTLACPSCGWKQIKCWPHGHESADYLNDLNAMHEAEKTLFTMKLRLEYYDYLNFICKSETQNTWSATAAQRAEAFLRTLGLWKEQ